MTLIRTKYHDKTNHLVGCSYASTTTSVYLLVACITHQKVKLGISKLAAILKMIVEVPGANMKGIGISWRRLFPDTLAHAICSGS